MKPARHYTDLIVWQLGEAIRIEVFGLTEKSRFDADFKARDQVEDAANSVTRNIAEGFGCETHGEFARFLEISRRSLNEIHDVLHGAELKKYVTSPELAPIRQLSKRLYPAYGRFIAYLKRTPHARPRRGNPPEAVTSPGRRAAAAPKRPGRRPNRSSNDPGLDRTDQRERHLSDNDRNRTGRR